MYELDFAKYAEPREIPRIHAVWHSLPSQLAKENRKFIYKVVKKGARSKDYEDALLYSLSSLAVCSRTGEDSLMNWAFKILSNLRLLRSAQGISCQSQRQSALPADARTSLPHGES